MPIYDMYCPDCEEDKGEHFFRTFSEYDNLNKRPRCLECRTPLEKKVIQGAFGIGGDSFGISSLSVDTQNIIPGFLP